MDADDVSKEERFENQIKELKKIKNVVALGTGMTCIDEKGNTVKEIRPVSSSNVLYDLLWKTSLAHPTVMMRRDAALHIGGYRSLWTQSEQKFNGIVRNFLQSESLWDLYHMLRLSLQCIA